VRSYPCFERDGIVFVWPGTAPAATPLERIGAAADPAYKTRRFGKLVRCHYSFMHENLMDMNHQFLHRRTTGKVTPRYLGSRNGNGWIEVDYSFSRPDQKPPLGEAVITGAWRGGSATARDLMTVRTEYPYQSLRMWTRSEDPVLSVWLGYTPTDTAQRRNRAFVVLSVRRPKIPGLLDVVWPVLAWFTGRVFAEDCEIVEMEQAAYDAQGEDRNQEVFPPIQKLRKLLQNCGRPLPR
jgi:renierapurpurin 18,18'-hydroxylase